MTAHVVTRFVPALRIVAVRDKPRRVILGEAGRIVALAVSLIVGLALAAWLLDASSWWTTGFHHQDAAAPVKVLWMPADNTSGDQRAG